MSIQRVARIALDGETEILVEIFGYDLDPEAGGAQPKLLANGRAAIRLVEPENESFDPELQERSGPEIVIEADRVRYVYTVTAIPLADLKARRIGQLHAIFEMYGQALVASYAPTERETWAEQALAAQEYFDNPAGDHAFLEGMTKNGETVAQLATTILDNRAIYRAGAAALIKVRRVHEAAIVAASSATALAAIDLTAGWPVAE